MLNSSNNVFNIIKTSESDNNQNTPYSNNRDIYVNGLKVFFNKNNVCKINSSSSKFTCKYEIHFENQRLSSDFSLAKRIIGPKGSNMKNIIEQCFQGRRFNPDCLKLRLRGKGSGFREGPNRRGKNLQLQCLTFRM